MRIILSLAPASLQIMTPRLPIHPARPWKARKRTIPPERRFHRRYLKKSPESGLAQGRPTWQGFVPDRRLASNGAFERKPLDLLGTDWANGASVPNVIPVASRAAAFDESWLMRLFHDGGTLALIITQNL